ncbi:hypothetical protein AO9_00745 [Chlamydia psittaci Mat116]|nr:hypothetical protein AO9_00745 [Chlamydia psittaci Mat116]
MSVVPMTIHIDNLLFYRFRCGRSVLINLHLIRENRGPASTSRGQQKTEDLIFSFLFSLLYMPEKTSPHPI